MASMNKTLVKALIAKKAAAFPTARPGTSARVPRHGEGSMYKVPNASARNTEEILLEYRRFPHKSI